MINLLRGDCLELMKDIPNKSIDMVLCDLPYGTTRCKWDSIIPFEPLWEQYNRIIKDNGAIVLFSQMPFTAVLVMSNLKMFRYEWIAEKSMATGFLNAKRMPLKCHENICVFYKKLPTYNAQMTKGKPYSIIRKDIGEQYLHNFESIETKNEGTRCPRDILRGLWKPYCGGKLFHPTQKPVPLLEYLIKTYTNEGETVLDNCMGSGSTGVACVNTNRNFIGIELDEKYFKIAKEGLKMLKLGNCMELIKDIPDNSIDLIVTDPPYKITARGNGGNSGGMFQKKIVNSGQVFTHNDLDISDWIEELYRVLKEKSHCYIMCNNKNIYHYLDVINKTKFHYVKCLVWVKNNKIMGQSYMSQFEFIIMLRKGAHKRINYCGTSDVLVFANDKMKDDEGKTIHDTEKPVALVKVLIENSSNVGDTVLDPFMGINSTGLACKLLGRKFIGFEINKKYYDVAKERLII